MKPTNVGSHEGAFPRRRKSGTGFGKREKPEGVSGRIKEYMEMRDVQLKKCPQPLTFYLIRVINPLKGEKRSCRLIRNSYFQLRKHRSISTLEIKFFGGLPISIPKSLSRMVVSRDTRTFWDLIPSRRCIPGLHDSWIKDSDPYGCLLPSIWLPDITVELE